MITMGLDFHPEPQQIATLDNDAGELQEKRLLHRGEAEKFYRTLAAAGQRVRVGMEASGHARWLNDSWRSCSLSVDRRRNQDPAQTTTQAENGSARRSEER